MKSLFAALGLALLASPLASADLLQNKDGFINLTPFGSTPVDEAKMTENISSLLHNSDTCATSPDTCVKSEDVEAIKASALNFRKIIQDKVNAALTGPDAGKIPYHDSWYVDGSREYHTVTFKSLFQREVGNPNNTITLKYVTPIDNGKCPSKIKTAITMSGAPEDTADDIIRMSRIISKMSHVATVFMYLPQYGPRRQLPDGKYKLDVAGSHTPYDPDEFNNDFLNIADRTATENNVAQAMLDLHLTTDWINTVKRCPEPPSTSLMSISLGSAVGLVYEGLEPNRLTGGDAFYAPGADLPHSVDAYLKVPRYDDMYFKKVIRQQKWNTDEGRKIWGEFDPMTWAGQIKNRQMLLINAKKDTLFIKKYAFDPLYAALKDNNKIKLQWNNTDHDPSVDHGALYEAVRFFLPIMSYLNHHGVSLQPECNQTTP